MTSAIALVCLLLTVAEAGAPAAKAAKATETSQQAKPAAVKPDAGKPDAAKPDAAKPAAPPSLPAPKDAASENLQMRYARSRLKLAQANLQRVEEMNRKLDRTVPSSVVSDFKREVIEAELQFQQASSETGDGFDIWLRRAENAWRSATTRWQNAQTANKQVKDTIPALDVERFRLRVEVAQLQWERGKALAKAPREEQLAWQVDLLSDEVELLREETSRVAPFVRYYPIWLY